jgi:hypothetical protein
VITRSFNGTHDGEKKLVKVEENHDGSVVKISPVNDSVPTQLLKADV